MHQSGLAQMHMPALYEMAQKDGADPIWYIFVRLDRVQR